MSPFARRMVHLHSCAGAGALATPLDLRGSHKEQAISANPPFALEAQVVGALPTLKKDMAFQKGSHIGLSARDALKSAPFKPDFDAYLSTPKALNTLSFIGPARFVCCPCAARSFGGPALGASLRLRALSSEELDKDPAALEEALRNQAGEPLVALQRLNTTSQGLDFLANPFAPERSRRRAYLDSIVAPNVPQAG